MFSGGWVQQHGRVPNAPGIIRSLSVLTFSTSGFLASLNEVRTFCCSVLHCGGRSSSLERHLRAPLGELCTIRRARNRFDVYCRRGVSHCENPILSQMTRATIRTTERSPFLTGWPVPCSFFHRCSGPQGRADGGDRDGPGYQYSNDDGKGGISKKEGPRSAGGAKAAAVAGILPSGRESLRALRFQHGPNRFPKR